MNIISTDHQLTYQTGRISPNLLWCS